MLYSKYKLQEKPSGTVPCRNGVSNIMVNESTVKTFLAIARLGSFTAAGRELYLSQQAVSKQIAKMEQDLDCTLFHRDRGKLSMTGAGKIYYEAFSKIADIYTEARMEAGKITGSWDNTLFIGVPEMLDLRFATQKLNTAFSGKNPEVSIFYRSEPHWVLLEQLERGELDMVFTFSRETELLKWPKSVHIEDLHELLIISADHPKARPDAGYMDFTDETVFYTPVAQDADEDIRSHMEALHYPVTHLTPTQNIMSTCANVEQGQGIAFLLDRCRLIQSDVFRTYPTDITAGLVLAYKPDIKKRCARSYLKMAEKLFA